MTDPYAGPTVERLGYVSAKLDRMRKPQQFHVSPTSDGRVMVQSDKSIGMFDFRTRRGVLNTKGQYFMHLNAIMGARPFEFPADFVEACLVACPALDSVLVLGGGVAYVNATVEIIRPA